MSLPINAIERLFTHLAAVYGEDFQRKLGPVPIANVKTAWAHQLGGFDSPAGLQAIAWALDNLPERPPNAVEFRALCRAAPRTHLAEALPPPPPASPERVQEAMEKLLDVRLRARASGAQSHTAGRDWARSLKARIDRGIYRPSVAQREMVNRALGLSNEGAS